MHFSWWLLLSTSRVSRLKCAGSPSYINRALTATDAFSNSRGRQFTKKSLSTWSKELCGKTLWTYQTITHTLILRSWCWLAWVSPRGLLFLLMEICDVVFTISCFIRDEHWWDRMNQRFAEKTVDKNPPLVGNRHALSTANLVNCNGTSLAHRDPLRGRLTNSQRCLKFSRSDTWASQKRAT